MINRFKQLREEEQDRRRDVNHRHKLTIEMLSKELEEKQKYKISPAKIKKLETGTYGVKIDSGLLLAYSKYFNVSVDWLINPSVRTRHIEGDIVAAHKITGLSDESCSKLKDYDEIQKKLLDHLIKNDAMGKLLDAFIEYPTLSNSTEPSYEEYRSLRKTENLLTEIYKDNDLKNEIIEYRRNAIAEKYKSYGDFDVLEQFKGEAIE